MLEQIIAVPCANIYILSGVHSPVSDPTVL